MKSELTKKLKRFKLHKNNFHRISGHFQFRKPRFEVRDPKLIKKIAVKDFDHFVDRAALMDESVDKMIGKALISLKGQKWRGNKLRKINFR